MPTKAELEQEVQALKDQLGQIAEAVMEVDVGDGCRWGRLDFIEEHIGKEFVPGVDIILVAKLKLPEEPPSWWSALDLLAEEIEFCGSYHYMSELVTSHKIKINNNNGGNEE